MAKKGNRVQVILECTEHKAKRLTKAIKMVKSPKTGAYMFVESIMAPEQVNEWMSKQ
ncbi:MAG: DUF4295 domain-containing protein [Flavobacteriaceae bacterium]